MVNWIVEDGVFGSAIAPLISEIQAQGHQVRLIDYTNGLTDYERFFSPDECILFYGSLYKSDLKPIVKEASRIAQQQWDERR